MPERKTGLTKDSPITILEMPGGNSIFGRYRLSRAAPLLTGILDEAGYKNVTTIDPQYNTLPGGFIYRGKLTGSDWRKIIPSKALLISTLTSSVPQSEKVAREFTENNPEGWLILGGPHASLASEECLEWGKPGKVIVVRGEAEKTLPALLSALEENGSAKGIKGTTYKEGDAIVNEPDREYLTEEELSNSPHSIYSEAAKKGSRIHLLSNSRGCPHRCEFCAVTLLNGNCHRMKSDEAIDAQFKEAYFSKPAKPIFFIDDNSAAKPFRLERFLRRNIDLGMTERLLFLQLRAEIGGRRGFPDLLKRAGVMMAALGIESIFDDNLKDVDKGVSAETTKKGVRALREAGIWIHGMFIVGLDNDTLERLDDTVEWAIENVDTVQFFPPQPIPGTGFARRMTDQGRILTKDYNRYNGDNVVIRPINMSPLALQLKIYQMYARFYNFKRIEDPIGHITRRLTDGSSAEWRTWWRDTKVRMYANYTEGEILLNPTNLRYLWKLKEVSGKKAV